MNRLTLCAALATAAVALPTASFSQEYESERQKVLCNGMLQNRYLSNGTYVDCLNDEYAIEVDFSNKWAEAIGQSLMYASTLERLPGIILVCRSGDDRGKCLKHAYLIEQTAIYWRIGLTVWQCDADATALSECFKRDFMQDNPR